MTGQREPFFDPERFAGRTYRVLHRRGRKLKVTFFLATNEATRESPASDPKMGRIVLDSWGFDRTLKRDSPMWVFRREWEKRPDSTWLNVGTFRSATRGVLKNPSGDFWTARSAEAVQLEQRRRDRMHEDRGFSPRDGDPWASAEEAYIEFGGYVAVEADDRWIEGVYWGFMPAFPVPGDTAVRRAATLVAELAAEVGGRVAVHSEPLATRHGIANGGWTWPYVFKTSVSTRYAGALLPMFPDYADELPPFLEPR